MVCIICIIVQIAADNLPQYVDFVVSTEDRMVHLVTAYTSLAYHCTVKMKFVHKIVTGISGTDCSILAQTISFNRGNYYRHDASVVFVVKTWIHFIFLINVQIRCLFQLFVDVIHMT